jgi:hypothetical protein
MNEFELKEFLEAVVPGLIKNLNEDPLMFCLLDMHPFEKKITKELHYFVKKINQGKEFHSSSHTLHYFILPYVLNHYGDQIQKPSFLNSESSLNAFCIGSLLKIFDAVNEQDEDFVFLYSKLCGVDTGRLKTLINSCIQLPPMHGLEARLIYASKKTELKQLN